MASDTLCWTDIPVTNLDRAIKFYSAILGKEVRKLSEGGTEYGLLPHQEQNASGCLCISGDSVGNKNQPSQTGPLFVAIATSSGQRTSIGAPALPNTELSLMSYTPKAL